MAGEPFYRTLRGLDPYSDRFCRLLIRRLTRRTWFGTVAFVAVNMLAAFATACVWAIIGAVVVPAVSVVLGLAGADHGAIGVVQWSAAAVVGASAFGVAYRGISRGSELSALRDALRPRLIDGGQCMVCHYSLEGLSGRDHLVVCPECGRTVPISLAAVDLVQQMMARGELPPEGRFAGAAAKAGDPGGAADTGQKSRR